MHIQATLPPSATALESIFHLPNRPTLSLSNLKMILRRMPKMPPLLAPIPLHILLRTYSTRGSSITEPLGDTNKIRFFPAQGEDEARLTRKLNVLLEERGGRWRLTEDGKGIERCFRFKTFDSAWVTGRHSHIALHP